MTANFIDGQAFPPGYILDKEISGAGDKAPARVWIATSEQTGERVVVRLLPEDTSGNWQQVTHEIESVRGLVHPNVNLPSGYGTADHHHFVVEPYLAGGLPFPGEGQDHIDLIEQLIDVLAYIHQLDLCHGNLHPANILVRDSQLYITGMGQQGVSRHGGSYQSPQVQSGQRPDKSDDIYSLGRLLQRTLDQTMGASGTPVPPEITGLIQTMTSESPFDRVVDYPALKDSLERCFRQDRNIISAMDFRQSKTTETRTATVTPVTTRTNRGVSTQRVAGLMLALGVLAAGFFLLLPEPDIEPVAEVTHTPTIQTSKTAPVQQDAPSEPGPTPFEAARLEHLQQEGETIATEILRLQLDLEVRGVALWAGESFTASGTRLDEAEALFKDAAYTEAFASYTEIRDTLQNLLSSAPDTMAEAVERGDAALERGEHQLALEAFTIANAIAQGDAEIKNKLSRAENLEEVLRLAREAELRERENKYDEALAIYRQANALDPAWVPAAAGIDRINDALTTQRFRSAMSSALNAIAAKDYQSARDYFFQAEQIRPSSTEPADGLAQIKQAEINDAINSFRLEAETHAANNAWDKAITAYESALGISETLQFAIDGIAHATSRQDLSNRLNRYLSNPPLLQSDEELRDASALLKEALKVSRTDTGFTGQLDRLAKLISIARIEIPVTIRSDGKTSVTIRQHARLGNITAEVIYLIPGRYIITGERSGYRDTREELVLLGGRPPPEIMIASTERVR